MHILHRYILKQFLVTLALCLLTAVALFLVIDLFERSRTFLKEGAAIYDAVSYMLYKIPLIVNLMTPIAVLISTIVSVGRLSQLSEITAMRACGISVLWLVRPLIFSGFVISIIMFIAGETVVSYSTAKVEEIYQFSIKKKLEKGDFSQSNFWFRSANRFYNMNFYDSQDREITDLTLFEFDKHQRLKKRIDSPKVVWESDAVGWLMEEVVETRFLKGNEDEVSIAHFRAIPLVIPEGPSDFYNLQRKPETMNYRELGEYIRKLKDEGVPTTEYLVNQAAKLSFPFVNIIVILVAFPFALSSSRSGTFTLGFLAGVTIGYGYYVVHAMSISLGGAELIPVEVAAWSANILLGSLGGYLMTNEDYN